MHPASAGAIAKKTKKKKSKKARAHVVLAAASKVDIATALNPMSQGADGEAAVVGNPEPDASVGSLMSTELVAQPRSQAPEFPAESLPVVAGDSTVLTDRLGGITTSNHSDLVSQVAAVAEGAVAETEPNGAAADSDPETNMHPLLREARLNLRKTSSATLQTASTIEDDKSQRLYAPLRKARRQLLPQPATAAAAEGPNGNAAGNSDGDPTPPEIPLLAEIRRRLRPTQIVRPANSNLENGRAGFPITLRSFETGCDREDAPAEIQSPGKNPMYLEARNRLRSGRNRMFPIVEPVDQPVADLLVTESELMGGIDTIPNDVVAGESSIANDADDAASDSTIEPPVSLKRPASDETSDVAPALAMAEATSDPSAADEHGANRRTKRRKHLKAALFETREEPRKPKTPRRSAKADSTVVPEIRQRFEIVTGLTQGMAASPAKAKVKKLNIAVSTPNRTLKSSREQLRKIEKK
ncbi:uncharacterized protein BJ171DRAFT_595646 [Polychytrium aggregatum]|uniref:uncharacterized protein n=1 Tax=Polychytrium aggregatum TaxID=110093 RepID=UPI0022FE0CB6|nr:uncharacterized protein BJ171DRAFT_595646 [Polychytrium aggregatum]KAI9208495.1 hypothetical protein BJ171DRAFT_595646 [Polychytrium aggregatum]